MSNRHFKTYRAFLLVVIGALGLFACKPKQAAVNNKGVQPPRKVVALLDSMQQNEYDFKWLAVKCNVEFKSEKLSDSFKMHIRMRKDSAIWISATYYSVEVARFLCTPDTIRFMDKKSNEFYIGDYDYINDRFQTDLNFETLQALLLGNSIDFSQEDKIRASSQRGTYLLSSLKKRKLRRMDEGRNTTMELAYSVWLDGKSFRVSKLSIDDFLNSKFLKASYTDHKKVGTRELPHKSVFFIRNQGQEVEFTNTYLRVLEGKKQKMSFRIPEQYKPVSLSTDSIDVLQTTPKHDSEEH